jgi:DNA-binding NtrC family response regulator
MKEKLLIVEDQFVEADYLRLMLVQAGYAVTGIAHSVVQAQQMIKQERPDIVLLDIYLKGKLTGIDLARQLREENIAFVYLSASSNEEVLNVAKTTQPYGFLVKPFRERDLLVTLEIARYRHDHSMEAILRREAHLKDQLSAMGNNAVSWEENLLTIGKALQPLIAFDYLTAGLNNLHDVSSSGLSLLRIGYDEYQKIGAPELVNITGLPIKELIAMANNTSHDPTPALFNEKQFERLCEKRSLHQLFWNTFQMKSFLALPLQLSTGGVFVLGFYSRNPDAYHANHLSLLKDLQKPMTDAIESIFRALEKKTSSKRQVNHETAGNAAGAPEFEGIIGKSHQLLNVFDLIKQVAPSDTSVLILGESGTGKERIADCIHHLSPRKNKPFVKVNCATLPSTLIESELFGHEKGAFTGAIEKRIGKFEKADKGTIFLDEIGEMPIDLQVKLLRVLQEKYIERIGSRDVTRVDARVIAATNRNLEKEVAEGRFRLDLYYRLNVFPIELPPLRERSEDIADLALYFMLIYNRKAGKKITGFSEKVLKKMMAYDWPGNIRELENMVERSVLMAKGTIIEDMTLPNASKKENSAAPGDSRLKTIHENERDYIISVLKRCNGRIWGAGGAAKILNIPPTTLKSKMKKLGIRKEHFE